MFQGRIFEKALNKKMKLELKNLKLELKKTCLKFQKHVSSWNSKKKTQNSPHANTQHLAASHLGGSGRIVQAMSLGANTFISNKKIGGSFQGNPSYPPKATPPPK